MYRPKSVTRPAKAQVILLTCFSLGRTRKGLVGIVVFHFIFAYSPTCQPHEDDGVDDVFVTVRP